MTLPLKSSKLYIYAMPHFQSVASARTPMHLAAVENVPNIAKLLQKRGAHMSQNDINLATPLHLAVEYKCLSMVEYLLHDV